MVSGLPWRLSVVKSLPANAGDASLIPGLGRYPEKRNGNTLQYSCLENSMEREALKATVHRATKELDTTEVTKQQQTIIHTLIHFQINWCKLSTF